MQVRKRSEERRREIIAAALRIVATRGLGQLTVNALASEVGITGGALYRHFSSLDAILDEMAAHAVEILDASLPADSYEPLEWLERFVRSRVAAVSGNAGLARLLLSDQVALALPEPAVLRLREAVERTRAALERTLRRGQLDETIRSDLSSRELAPVLMGTVQMLALSQSGGLLQKVAAPASVWATLRTLLAPPKGARA